MQSEALLTSAVAKWIGSPCLMLAGVFGTCLNLEKKNSGPWCSALELRKCSGLSAVGLASEEVLVQPTAQCHQPLLYHRYLVLQSTPLNAAQTCFGCFLWGRALLKITSHPQSSSASEKRLLSAGTLALVRGFPGASVAGCFNDLKGGS